MRSFHASDKGGKKTLHHPTHLPLRTVHATSDSIPEKTRQIAALSTPDALLRILSLPEFESVMSGLEIPIWEFQSGSWNLLPAISQCLDPSDADGYPSDNRIATF